MSFVTTISKNKTIWCPCCGELLIIDDETYMAYLNGKSIYYICHNCNNSFYLEHNEENLDK